MKDKAEFAEEIFRNNPQDTRLRIHKLSGQLAGCWSFSIDYEYRIVFHYDDDNKQKIFFDLIGNHNIYK